MSDLTNGFSDAQLNDHSASDSIERVLEEASVAGALKECLLDGFKSELNKSQLESFEEVLRASLISGVTPGEQIAHFIRHYPYECRLFKRGDEFRDKCNDVIRNGSEEELKQLYRVILPTPLGIAVKTHIFPSSPIQFLRLSIGTKKLSPFHYEAAFQLYDDSPFKMLVREWLTLQETDREGLIELAPVKRLREAWERLPFEEKSLEECEKLLKRIAFYHEQLIDAGELGEANDLEYHDLAQCPTEDKEAKEEWFQARRHCSDLMRWQRLRATKTRSSEDSEEYLRLSFDLEKSFSEDDCPLGQLEDYIQASLQVIQVVAQDDGNNRFLGRYSLTGQLHKLWCYSRHKEAWLAALELKLDQLADKPKLLLIGYLLRGTGGVSINLKSFTRAYIRLNVEELRQFDTEFNIPVESKWLSELQKLQCAFVERKLYLEVAEAADLLDLLIWYSDNLTIRLKVADRMLAQIWLFPDSEPTLLEIHSSYDAQRLLMTYEPEKFLRILIQAFHKSQEPCCGEKLEYGAGNPMYDVEKSENPAHWFLCVMISNCLRLPYAWKQKKMFLSNSKKLSDEEVEELTHSLRKTVAEYCWKSLRLRKGETCDSEFYQNSQCTEPDPIWRQAYAKALSEIGLDLGGSVHKTLNFIREKDPDDSVRTAAASAYQSVRRKGNADGSDPIKGLLIAFWWFRLGQRKAMSLDVDPSSATRIRRDELRYADRVDSVINMIFL